MSEPAYLQLDPDVEQAIAENLRCGRMHPRSFPDEHVLRREDNPRDAATLARPAFSRDIDKIMNIPAYNRYAGKTQVFSASGERRHLPPRATRAACRAHRAKHRTACWD